MHRRTPIDRLTALARVAIISALAAAFAVLWLAGGGLTAHADDDGVTLDLQLDLHDDGVLAVTATITTAKAVTSDMDLDIPVEGNRVQHFQVADISTTGGATAAVQHDVLAISAPAGGTSTVSYTVRGTVANGPELQQVTWVLAAGWSAPIKTLTGTFVSPTPTPDSPICGYGQLDERRLCSLTQTELAGTVTFRHNNLKAGGVAVFSVLLPAGTVTPTARFTPITGSAAGHPANAAQIAAVAVATALALGLAGFAWLRRRADDAGALAPGSTAELVAPQGDKLVFASPDGVLPGQIGTLTTGRVRPADVGATVLDLAVRNYLWIAELPRSSGLLDFQISRRAPLDAAVTGYERAVVGAILPDKRESVTASQLTQRVVDLESSRAEIATSVVRGGWSRRRHRLEPAGFALLGGAAVAAACLALVGTGVLWAVAVAVLGGGIAAAGRLLPQRTVAGSRLVAALSGMRQYLAALDPDDVEEAVRPVLYGRVIPYAHALGELPGWLHSWPETQKVEWYQPSGNRPALAGLPILATMLDGVAARSEAVEER